jgi:hypothetical protein
MLSWLKWLFPLGMFSFFSFAAEVVFIEVHKDGHAIQLEPNGRFYHVAIRYKNQWLHAHTHRGVDLVNDIRPYGDRFLIVKNSLVPDPSPEFVEQWLGKPFDRGYHWDNPLATYCARLIADLFSIEPQVMLFQAPHWAQHFNRHSRERGLSPDELYEALIARGFKAKTDCETDLVPQ